MNLHFERRNGYFISEFEVTNDFNLHIEKDPTGQFLVYQRTAGGAYDLVADFGKNKGDDPVIDYDFSALVYPKYIQIKSSVNPVIATITTNGEVNELKYQEKSVEITSNGTSEITADAGYTALASVNVKVDVPQSGGSGDGGESGIEYWELIDESEIPRDLPLDLQGQWEEITSLLYLMGVVTKGVINNDVKFVNGGFNEIEQYRISKILAVCVIPSTLLSTSEFGVVSIKEYFDNAHGPLVELVGFDWSFVIKRKLTKEEFYNLNA